MLSQNISLILSTDANLNNTSKTSNLFSSSNKSASNEMPIEIPKLDDDSAADFIQTMDKIKNKKGSDLKTYINSFQKEEQYMLEWYDSHGKAARNVSGLQIANENARNSQLALNESMTAGAGASKAFSIGTSLLNGALSMGIGILANLAIGFVVDQFQQAAKAMEDAKEAANEFANEMNTLGNYKSTISELKTSLASGNLSDQESYNAKKQLLDIQNQLIDTYGEQAAAIDLVNGSLDGETSKISAIEAESANELLNKNKSSFEKAEKKLNKEGYDFLGTNIYDNGGSDSEILAIAKSLENQGVKLNDDGTGGFTLSVEGTAEERLKATNELMTQVRKLEKQYEGDFTISSILSNGESTLKSTQKIVDKYKPTVDEYKNSELVTDEEVNDLRHNFTSVVDELNSALLSGDTDAIETARKKYLDIKDAVASTIEDFPDSESIFTDIESHLDKSSLKIHEFNQSISDDSSIEKFKQQFKGLSDEDLSRMTPGENEDWDKLVAKAEEYGLEVDDVIGKMVEFGAVSSTTEQGLAASFEEVKGSVIDSSNNQNTMVSAISESNSGTGVSINTYDQLKDQYGDAFEQTSAGLTLNVKKLQELKKAEENVIRSNFANERQKLNQQLNNNKDKYDELSESLANAKDAEDQAKIQQSMNNIQSQNDNINQQLIEVGNLEAQYNGLTSAYQSWINAQNTENQGAAYDRLSQSADQIKQLYEEGLVGTDDFQAYVKLFINPEELDKDISELSAGELSQIYASKQGEIDKYFNSGKEGADSFIAALDELNLVTGEGEFLNIDAGNVEALAEHFGFSTEAIELMLEKLKEYGHEVEYETPEITPSELVPEVNVSEEVTETVAQIESQTFEVNGTVKLSEDGLTSAYEQLAAFNNTLQSLANVTGKAEREEGEQALQAQFDQLSEQHPEIFAHFNIGTSLEDLKEALNNETIVIPTTPQVTGQPQEEGQQGSGINAVQQTIDLVNATPVVIKVSTEGAEEAVFSLNSIFAAIAEKPINIKADITGIFAGVMTSMMYLSLLTDKTVRIIANTLNAMIGVIRVKSSLNSIQDKHINVYTNYVQSPFSPIVFGTGAATGTAHLPSLSGIAKAHGDWRVPTDTTALVGELGTEILVRNGKWHTIGDNGAEFRQIKSGDIIFNHRQSEELFRYGRISTSKKRGTAFASGTAFAKGSASGSDEEFSQEIDWSKTRVTKVKDIFDLMTSYAKNVLLTYKEQNNFLNKSIQKGHEYIAVLKAQQRLYYDKAAAVGLEASYIEKIHNGTLNVENITDEDLNQRIQDYQEWYDLAIGIDKEIKNISEELRDLAQQKLKNLTDDFDFILGRAEKYNSLLKARIDLKKEKGISTTESDYATLIQQMANIQTHQEVYLKKLTSQFNELISQGVIKEYTDDWYDWKKKIDEANISILDSKSSIAGLRTEILELRFKVFDDLFEKVDRISTKAETMDQLLGKAENYKKIIAGTAAEVTDAGFTRLGLMMQNLAIAKQKVVDYEEAMIQLNDHLKAGNISQEDYNKKVEEYKKGQMDATKEVHKAKQAYIDFAKEGIDKATESYKKLIDEEKKALREEDEDQKWNEKVSDQENKILEIQKKISALSGDSSKDAAAKRKKLEEELNKELKAQTDMYADYELKMKEKALDDDLTNFEERQDEKKELLDSSLSAQEEAIKELADFTLENQSKVFDGLAALTDEYKGHIHVGVIDPWKSATSALELYKKALTEVSQISKSPDLNDNYGGTIAGSKGNTWHQDANGWWLEYAKGGYAKNSWVQQGDDWYLFNEKGYMKTGWNYQNNDWFYMDGSGRMQTGWIHDGKDWYYSNPDGRMQTGWIDDGKDWYYSNADGRMQTGWINNGGKWYYLDGSGRMLSNTVTPDNFHVGQDGAWLGYRSGAYSTKNGWGFQDEDGLGSEAFITNKGLFRQFQQGETIFNKEQTKQLWELSKLNLGQLNFEPLSPSDLNSALSSATISNSPITIGGSHITIEGNVDQHNIRNVEQMIHNALDKHNEDLIFSLRKYR